MRTPPELEDTWKQIVKRYRKDGEDIAQEVLDRVFKRASRGKVEKPLHYLAKSAKHIAINLGKRRGYAQAYKQAIIGKRPDGGPARVETGKGSSVVLKKVPLAAPRPYCEQPDRTEVLELLREVALDSTGHLLIRQACGERVEITPSQESKLKARLRAKLKAQKRESKDPRLMAL